ncbi:YbaB/EbfC family nucleoid-associated protein (plasmid) [Streptomyces sp. NBC_01527]|uniref:YbaB/EbfC family nucleoid-associated protein n=1 Tax=unclassified Streptomyces TaxID=2593676 RepID=UPI002E0FD27F|nr:YbaB/EbfC family nucleoid-associated protein [Streptomyces sp. NBC_01230]
MSNPYDQQIEDLLAKYRQRRDEAVETQRRINATTATATAPRQTVKVTVGAQGQVTALDFPTGAYRRMPPKELADVLLTTIQQARSEALESVNAISHEALPPGVNMADLLQGHVDVTAIIPEEPATSKSMLESLNLGISGENRG